MFVVLGRLLDSNGLGDAGASFLDPVVLLGMVCQDGDDKVGVERVQVPGGLVQEHRETALRKTLTAAANNRRCIPSKVTMEASVNSIKFARMLALADAKEVERYLSGIDD